MSYTGYPCSAQNTTLVKAFVIQERERDRERKKTENKYELMQSLRPRARQTED